MSEMVQLRERVRDFIYDCTKDEGTVGWTLSAHQTDDLIGIVRSAALTASPDNPQDLIERLKGHTPGPWTIVRYGDGDSLVIHAGDSEWRICFMATPGSSHAESWAAIKANARLVAAAPQLLNLLGRYREALCEIVEAQKETNEEAERAERPGENAWSSAPMVRLIHAHKRGEELLCGSPTTDPRDAVIEGLRRRVETLRVAVKEAWSEGFNDGCTVEAGEAGMPYWEETRAFRAVERTLDKDAE